MINNKISIIIPIYNGEKHIKKCVESLLEQNGDFEIILVDDGSTDNSLKILKEISSNMEDKVSVVISNKNKGVSSARNLGILNSTGKYIMFCDIDDTYPPNVIKHISETIDNYNPDFIAFGREDISNDKTIAIYHNHNEVKKLNINKFDYYKEYLLQGKHTFSVVNKVYKKEIIDINNIKFPTNLKLSEDLYFNLIYTMYSNSFVEDFRSSYRRTCTEGSTIYKNIDDFYSENIRIIEEYLSYLNKNKIYDKTYKENICYLYYYYGRISIFRLFEKIDGSNMKDRINKIKKISNSEEFKKQLKIKNKSKDIREALFEFLIKYQFIYTSYFIFSISRRGFRLIKGLNKLGYKYK